jgi:hypothetical protein
VGQTEPAARERASTRHCSAGSAWLRRCPGGDRGGCGGPRRGRPGAGMAHGARRAAATRRARRLRAHAAASWRRARAPTHHSSFPSRRPDCAPLLRSSRRPKTSSPSACADQAGPRRFKGGAEATEDPSMSGARGCPRSAPRSGLAPRVPAPRALTPPPRTVRSQSPSSRRRQRSPPRRRRPRRPPQRPRPLRQRRRRLPRPPRPQRPRPRPRLQRPPRRRRQRPRPPPPRSARRPTLRWVLRAKRRWVCSVTPLAAALAPWARATPPHPLPPPLAAARRSRRRARRRSAAHPRRSRSGSTWCGARGAGAGRRCTARTGACLGSHRAPAAARDPPGLRCRCSVGGQGQRWCRPGLGRGALRRAAAGPHRPSRRVPCHPPCPPRPAPDPAGVHGRAAADAGPAVTVQGAA